MVKTRKISFAAAILILIIAVMPLLSLNAAASSKQDYFEGTITKGGTYKVALLDADFHDSDEGCLTSSQETQLLNLMQETADKIKCNVGIAIVSDLKGMSPQRFSSNFTNTMFGAYEDSATFLFLNRHGNPLYSSYTDDMYFKNRAEELFNKKADSIFDIVYKPIDKNPNDLYGAGCAFCSALTKYGTGIGAVLAKFNINGKIIFFACIVGVIITFAIVMPIVKGYKKKKPVSASHYIDKSRTRINRQVDQFVREYTTSVRIQSSSGGGGGRSGGGGSHHSGRGR